MYTVHVKSLKISGMRELDERSCSAVNRILESKGRRVESAKGTTASPHPVM